MNILKEINSIEQSFDLKGEINMFQFIIAVLGLFIMSKYEKWKCAKDYREYMTEQKEGLNIK